MFERLTIECLRLRLSHQVFCVFTLIAVLLVASIVNVRACNAQAAEGKRERELILKMDPPLTFVNKSRDVIFRVNVVKGINDVVDTVQLMQTDAEGNPIAEVGVMNDNGENGDWKAGNESYAATLTFNEPIPVTRYYQAIVSLKNDSRKILSEVQEFRITEKPYSKDPDENKLVHGQGLSFPINQVIIRLPEGETKITAQALADMVNGEVVGYTPTLNLYLLEVPSETVEDLDAMIDRLEDDPRTVDASRNLMLEPDLE